MGSMASRKIRVKDHDDMAQHLALAAARAKKAGANVSVSLENAAKDYWKAMARERKRRSRTRSLDDLLSEPAVPSFLNQLAMVDMVNTIMAMLPPDTRQALAMLHIDDLPQDTVASSLGISRATLKRRIEEAAASLDIEKM